MKIAALSRPFFSKYKIEERNDETFYALRRSVLFWYKYISRTDDFEWSSPEFIVKYCRCQSLKEAQSAIDRYLEQCQRKKEIKNNGKIKRFIKYP